MGARSLVGVLGDYPLSSSKYPTRRAMSADRLNIQVLSSTCCRGFVIGFVLRCRQWRNFVPCPSTPCSQQLRSSRVCERDVAMESAEVRNKSQRPWEYVLIGVHSALVWSMFQGTPTWSWHAAMVWLEQRLGGTPIPSRACLFFFQGIACASIEYQAPSCGQLHRYLTS